MIDWGKLNPTVWFKAFEQVKHDDPILYYVVIVSLVTAFVIVPLLKSIRKK